MTAESMKFRDLRRWNRVQLILALRMGIGPDPDNWFAFGNWFAKQVDTHGRLPRFRQGMVLHAAG